MFTEMNLVVTTKNIKMLNFKSIKQSKTLKIALIALIVFVILGFTDLSFILMNMASTPAFIIGHILLIISFGLPIEYVYHKYLKRKNK